jgi:hypothetical protein
VGLAADGSPDLVLLAPVLERHPDDAIGEDAVGPDVLPVGPSPPVQAEEEGLHECALPGAVRPEDADHPGGKLQVELLEHPEVPKRDLQDPHDASA